MPRCGSPRLGPGIVQNNALLASWPEPDMLRQVVSRLNQWVDTLQKPAPSEPDPMLASLPAEFRKLPMVEENWARPISHPTTVTC